METLLRVTNDKKLWRVMIFQVLKGQGYIKEDYIRIAIGIIPVGQMSLRPPEKIGFV